MPQDFLNNLMNHVLDASGPLGQLNSVRQVEVNDVPLGDGYRSVTAARRSFKPFIVGIIPPDTFVNFRAVDVVNSRLSMAASNTQSNGATSGNNGSVGRKGNNQPPGKAGPIQDIYPVKGSKNCTQPFLTAMQEMCARHNLDPTAIMACISMETAGTFDPAKKNMAGGAAFGLIQFMPYELRRKGYDPAQVAAMSQSEQVAVVESWYAQVAPRLKRVDDYYLAIFAPSKIGQKGSAPVYRKDDPNPKLAQAYASNSYLDKDGKGYISVDDACAQIRGIYNWAKARPPMYVEQTSTEGGIGYYNVQNAVAGPEPMPGKPPGADIMMSGDLTDMESGDPLSSTGRNIRKTVDKVRHQVVQRQVDQLNDQILAAWSVPPLAMAVSPEEFTRGYEHSVDAPKARRGHVVHVWLEKPMTVTCKGVTAAQYILNPSMDGGLTNRFRVQSLSYKNLSSLVRIYKNNGYIYSGDAFGDLNGGIPMVAMSVYVYFDGHVYVGSFDDFSVTDAADKPYNMAYSWKFTVRYDVDVTAITDNQIVGLEDWNQ